MTCPSCGADVRHPPLKFTSKGTIEVCDQCGAALGEPEPVALGFMKALIKTDTRKRENRT